MADDAPPLVALDAIRLRVVGWVLDAETGEPRPEPDRLAWAQWMETDPRRQLGDRSIGRVRVSTIFLGLDHNWHPSGSPILWETMIFGGIFDGDQQRYQTREEALDGHAACIVRVEAYRDAPRRIRKSVRKLQLGHPLRQPLTRGDGDRISRFHGFCQRRTP